MSIALPTVDLTGFVAGQTGKIDLSNTGPDSNPAFTKNKPQVILYNESGCGLQVSFQKGVDQHMVPAGAWVQLAIEPGEKTINFVVLYTLPNPPVSKLVTIYYAPGEPPPPLLILGNSPIGIGGTVNTSSSTISNEGSGPNLLVVDMGDIAFPDILTLYNDGHALWAVDQSGVKHQVIKVLASGNPLQLGQAGDTTEVLGNLLIDSGELGKVTSGDMINSDGTNITVQGLGARNVGQVLLGTSGNTFFKIYRQFFSGTSGYSVIEAATGEEVAFHDGNGNNFFFSGGGSVFFGAAPGQLIEFQIPAGASSVIRIASTIAHFLIPLLTDSTLSVVGSSSLDNGAITTTGSGGMSLNGVLSLLSNLSVLGTSSLDSGNITTDGIGTLKLGKANSAFAGSVSGSANIYTPLWGNSLKVMVVAFNNYNSANAISFTLPSPMGRGWIWIGNQGGGAVASHFESSGVAVNVRLITALAAAGGSTTTQSNMFQDSMASIISTVDTWKMAATAGVTSSAIVCVGV